MARLTKQLGYRVDGWTLKAFRDVCAAEGLRPSQAVERFMELAVQKGSVEGLISAAERSWAEKAALNEAKARVLLAWLEEEKYWYTPREEEVSVVGELYQMLDKIRDKDPLKKIEETLKKAA